MGELIDRQAAIDALREAFNPSIARFAKAKIAIEKLAPAELQIIRCKDCKHRDKYGCCTHWKGLAMGDIPIATDDNDFCSNAER